MLGSPFFSSFLHTNVNLLHGRPTPHATSTAPTESQPSQRQRSHKRGKQEPHERRASLQLTTLLLQTITTLIAAVPHAQHGREHNGVNEREEHRHGVGGQQHDGDRERLDNGSDESVQRREPGEHNDKHGEVDGRVGDEGIVVRCGDDVAYEGGEEDDPEELECAKGDLNECHGGRKGKVCCEWRRCFGCLWVSFVCGEFCFVLRLIALYV